VRLDRNSRTILLVPLGLSALGPERVGLTARGLAALAEPLSALGCEVDLYSGPSLDLREAYEPGRDQFNANTLQAQLLARFPKHPGKVVAVTGYDLFAPGLAWIFGQAQVQGRTAIVSLHRLSEEFYGRRADAPRACLRLVTELGHELGHAFGLGHCETPRCVMRWSATVGEIDAKGTEPCDACTQRLLDLASLVAWRAKRAPAAPLMMTAL